MMSKYGLPKKVKACALTFSALLGFCAAEVTAQTMADYNTLPRSLDQGVAPMIMLALSNDHQLYFKAYTDYDDLNDNGDLETDEITYSNDRNYAGYFSNQHCYTYGGALFEITNDATGDANKKHYCSVEGEWSGNFLNWATMTRIDVLRYVLYGGLRSNNEPDSTVLERSYLPNDAHSFAKYYNGSDLGDLTPLSNIEGGDQGITICNTTLHTGAAQKESKSNSNPPLMRVVKGNFGLWASGERYQCLFWGHEEDENGDPVKDENGNTVYNDTVNEGLNAGVDRRGKASPDASKNAAAIEAFTLASGGNFIPVLDSPNIDEVNDSFEGDYNLYISACPNANADEIEGCKSYGETYKPTGLLHTSGANGDALYGLLTGSYEDNKQGGYLRKNIGVITDEINAATGQFIAPPEGGIIQTLDRLRIAGWRESDGTAWAGDDNVNNADGAVYNEESAGANLGFCKWSRIGFDNGHCVDWGNPLGEILGESYRYFAGIDGEVNKPDAAGVTASVLEGDKAPTDVKKAQWAPLTDEKYSCANMNVIGLNTSAQTFEAELDAFADGLTDATSTNIDDATDTLLDDGAYFVGDATGDALRTNISCSAKTVTNLSDAIGPCPDAPGLEGTWRAAGLAKIVSGRADIAADEDVSDDGDSYDLNGLLTGSQRVVTHGLQLATTLPLAKIKYEGRTLVITPMCESWGDADEGEDSRTYLGNCALVDFKVLSKSDTEGAFYVNWEDSEQGGDYDQDMHGILSYEIDGTMLKVTTKVIGQSSEKRLGFGYVLAGLGASDGVYVNSGINGYPGVDNYKYPGCDNETATGYTAYQNKKFYVNGRDDRLGGNDPVLFKGCGLDNAAATKPHLIDAEGGDAQPMPPVLQLAALGAGGQFVSVNDPDSLKDELNSIIGNLGPKPIAGGGEVAASGGSGGTKLFLHTTYYSQRENSAGDRVNWVGQVGALHLDNKGRLREDTPGGGRVVGELDPTDYIIRFSKTLKDANDQPVVEKYSLEGEVESAVEGGFTFDDINYIWNATDSLAAQAAQVDGRNIYTALPDLTAADINTDVVKVDDLPKFNTDTFASETAELLLGGGVPRAELVAFIQGSYDDAAGTLRSRTLDAKKYLLGDVLTSPVIQGRPDYTYANELSDDSYKVYQNKYADAAKIAYVAANDGLIHAFYAAQGSTPLEGKTLGEELWAYAPFNLLPHLQWLPNKRYSHVPYFDGYMRTFDVKAFPEGHPDIYPGGWGTILVVGTGLGGGAYGIDLDGKEVSTRPAYIVLDITNRNLEKPKLIAEISHEQLGFTTGEPDVARFKEDASDPAEFGKWYLVFGSGPRGYDQSSARSAQQNYTLEQNTPELNRPHLFAFNLTDKTTLTTHRIADADPLAFIGGVNSMDWDRDFADDMLYFGTVAGTQETPSGKLWRAKVSLGGTGLNFEPSVMFDTQKPVAKRPATVIDYRNNYWVFTGTGRYYVRSDAANNNSGNIYLGLKEQRNADTGALASAFIPFTVDTLFNTTGVTIKESGALENAGNNTGGSAINYIDGLRKEIAENKDGWYINFGGNERQHTGTGYAASTLFFSTTVPGASESCSSGDQGYVYLIDMRSGVFSPFYKPTASSGDNQNNGTNVDSVLGSIDIFGPGPVLEGPYPPTDVWNLASGGVEDGPEPVEFKSQRHSWREVQAPW